MLRKIPFCSFTFLVFFKKPLTKARKCDMIMPISKKAMTKTAEKERFQRTDGWCESVTGFFKGPSLPSRKPERVRVGVSRDCCVKAYGLFDPEGQRKL